MSIPKGMVRGFTRKGKSTYVSQSITKYQECVSNVSEYNVCFTKSNQFKSQIKMSKFTKGYTRNIKIIQLIRALIHKSSCSNSTRIVFSIRIQRLRKFHKIARGFHKIQRGSQDSYKIRRVFTKNY